MSFHNRFTNTVAIIVLGLTSLALGDDSPIPPLLAKRGKLIVDDDGSKDRGGKTVFELKDGVGVKAALGSWARSKPESNIWRSTWTKGMGHPPVVSYPGFKANNLIVEVTFRYGKATEAWHSQFIRIAADQRPEFKGHIVSAWANPNGKYTKTGFVLEHINKKNEIAAKRAILMDHQPIETSHETWYTAILEIVDDEALFRTGDHLAYAKAEQIRHPKNLVSLTLGTTWHEIKRVRIWHAETHPDWKTKKDLILKSRTSFTSK